MRRHNIFLASMLLLTGSAFAQSNFGNSTPSPTQSCGIYQWPVISSPCPEVQIKQKHDHTPYPQYRSMGWDTVATCDNRTLTLSCMPYIPVKYFTGGYYVDVIPYNPPDTTFYLDYPGYDSPNKVKMPINTDDDFAGSSTQIPYPFYFFGIRKTAFVIGANGLVTFNTSAAGQSCPWSYSASIPWTDNTSGAPSPVARMRDAIYGVYEDTHPLSSYLSGHQGIYYGVVDEYPCRKIIASWNEVPEYNGSSNLNNRCTYQIVCYEGSNIIEVHIKRRGVNTGWQNGIGLIGIQNATGTGQTQGSIGEPNMYVINGSPAAFWPQNKNTFNTVEEYTAYRFTPNGQTPKQYKWYQIFDDDRDSIQLTTDPTNPNGYYEPMDPNGTCPTLSLAHVTPTEVSRYVFELIFSDANNNRYFLRDTITIGMDTANDMSLKPVDGTTGTKVYNICQGTTGNLVLEYPSLQQPTDIVYTVTRMSDGTPIELPANEALTLGSVEAFGNTTRRTVTLRSQLPTTGTRPNKIDSIYVQASTDFISGCHGYDSILIKIYPNFDTTEVMKICKGESYTWSANNQTYNQTVNATANLHSTPGCDSTVHLNLTVLETSITIDHVTDCKPYTWINGVTYEASNTATSANDTVRRTNIWGCDSIVQLDLTILPLTARIGSNRTYFDYDILDAELNDISTNGDSRLWVMPNGNTSTAPTLYYTIPSDLDSADILMIASSIYGCTDSAHIIIPMRKESFWIPNAFTPDNSYGNRIFSSISIKTLTQEMYIYNRNGQLVFKCEGPDCPWDGRDLNGNLCPQGVYTYVIRYTNAFLPKQTQVRRGTVTLIR